MQFNLKIEHFATPSEGFAGFKMSVSVPKGRRPNQCSGQTELEQSSVRSPLVRSKYGEIGARPTQKLSNTLCGAKIGLSSVTGRIDEAADSTATAES